MHEIRSVALTSYLEVARFLGINGGRLLSEVGISPAQLEDSESRLPASAGVKLLEKSAEASGCDSFGIRMAQCRTFSSIGGISLLLERLATVREVVETMAQYRRATSDITNVNLEVTGDVAMITADVMPPFNRPQAVDVVVGVAFIALVGATSGRWAPEAVHFTHKRPRDIGPFESFFRAPLQFDSSFNGYSCPVRALDIALPRADKAMARAAARLLGQVTVMPEQMSLSDRTKRGIILLLPYGRATIEEVAACLDQSPRTVQRGLELEGLSFRSLLGDVRRELAQRYLAGSGQTITDVATQLGYSTATSFTRWFHDNFGQSPREWRNSQQSIASAPPPLWKR